MDVRERIAPSCAPRIARAAASAHRQVDVRVDLPNVVEVSVAHRALLGGLGELVLHHVEVEARLRRDGGARRWRGEKRAGSLRYREWRWKRASSFLSRE